MTHRFENTKSFNLWKIQLKTSGTAETTEVLEWPCLFDELVSKYL